MDDTIFVATTRQNIILKLRTLPAYCGEYGMKVKESKTNFFFVVNGDKDDKSPLCAEHLVIDWCDSCIY